MFLFRFVILIHLNCISSKAKNCCMHYHSSFSVFWLSLQYNVKVLGGGEKETKNRK